MYELFHTVTLLATYCCFRLC